MIKQGAGDLLNGTLNGLRILIDLVINVVKDFVTWCLSVLDTVVEIPVISALYKRVAHADLTLLDLMCLLHAIPSTLIYKFMIGQAPFKNNGYFPIPQCLFPYITPIIAATISCLLIFLHSTRYSLGHNASRPRPRPSSIRL